MPKQSRIRWNDAEKETLVMRGREVMAERPMKLLEALSRAQTALPRNRRRRVTQSGKVAWFVKGVRGNGAVAAVAVTPLKGRGNAGPPPGNGTKATLPTHAVNALRAALVEVLADVFAESLQVAAGRATPSGTAPSRRSSKKQRPAKTK